MLNRKPPAKAIRPMLRTQAGAFLIALPVFFLHSYQKLFCSYPKKCIFLPDNVKKVRKKFGGMKKTTYFCPRNRKKGKILSMTRIANYWWWRNSGFKKS